ncbi:cupin domain-containing protein [Pontibacter sp. BAB1700]|uniref:cupin domain-containing protein n=1 Tax=Pontibacter sp. BAB1700 TaxID=1144253 RepID=UPI00026BC13C|nr:cupin domain-containing protein [Pontibacter sp. BAB1700]EJF11085.1 mannose-6-phosphate isomerase [Pontibacter sp. BAB1700]
MTEISKSTIFNQIAQELTAQSFETVNIDESRPWGGFFVIEEGQAPAFASKYFNGLSADSLKIAGKLSPKILVVAPEKRLSWQYHHRRAEIWTVLQGQVGVVTSETDIEGEVQVLNTGDVITLKQGERHRLVGLQDWGVLAEIWQHTDADNPSDEEDIVRVQDDFGR